MSASFTMSADWRFPTGTTLGVYKGGDPMTGPPGPAITTAVVAANGTAAFTGLLFDTDYVLGALVSGKWFDSNFRTTPDPAALTASVAEVAAVSAHVDSVENNSARKPAAAAGVQFVDPAAGSDANDGLSWGTAKATIAAAVAAATATGGLVRLATGTHSISAAVSIPNFVNILGEGQSTVVRCTGNHYAFNLNPGNRVSIRNLTIDALSTQSSGGGIDFTNAANNVWISDLYMGSGLHTSFNMAPTGGGGHFYVTRVRWNGPVGNTFGFVIGDGSAITSNVWITHCHGAVALTTDMSRWVKIRKGGADTVHMTDCLFYQGDKGMEIGVEGASGDATNHKFTSVVFDNMNVDGIEIASCQGVDFVNCAVQGCGTTTLAGLRIGTNAKAVTWNGGFIHECEKDGIEIAAGAIETMIVGAKILNNNRTNQTFGSGISAVANASSWTVMGCVIGNDLSGVTANQKYGILVGGGTSTNVVVKGNRFPGNVTAAYLNSGVTGAGVVWSDNIPEIVNTVASANALTLPPGAVVIVSGTANITSITAGHVGREVTLLFTGTNASTGVTDGSNLKLASNLVYTPDDTITLWCDGTNWFEKGRSVN